MKYGTFYDECDLRDLCGRDDIAFDIYDPDKAPSPPCRSVPYDPAELPREGEDKYVRQMHLNCRDMWS